MTKKDQRQRLIDSFINAIYLFDEKIMLTFNYKDETKTITFNELSEVLGSDFTSSAAPNPYNPNQSRQIISVGDGFGLLFYFDYNFFPNGKKQRPESKP